MVKLNKVVLKSDTCGHIIETLKDVLSIAHPGTIDNHKVHTMLKKCDNIINQYHQAKSEIMDTIK